MNRFILILALITGLVSCDGSNAGKGDSPDSASTDSLNNPSFNPKVEADSAAGQMNLDSTNLKDSGTNHQNQNK